MYEVGVVVAVARFFRQTILVIVKFPACHDVPMNGEDTRTFWDAQAATFDDEPDHGLTDPVTRQAWATLLDAVLRDSDSAVVDLGCGTGSLSILLAQRGHRVFGIDMSPKMVQRAAEKARHDGLDIEFMAGDVQTVAVPRTTYGVVVSRHLLWAVDDPKALVARWSAPLIADGLFVAIEGVWDRAGIPADEVFSALQMHFQQVEYIDLSDQTALWGKEVVDHRYAVVGRHPRHRQPPT